MKGLKKIYFLLLVLCTIFCECQNTQTDPVDLIITIKFPENFNLEACDELVVEFIADIGITLQPASGETADGGISYSVENDSGNDAFFITISKDWVKNNAVLINQNVHELDIPFQGGTKEGGFQLKARILYNNESNKVEIGFGSAYVELPAETSDKRIRDPLEVSCHPNYSETCLTGNPPG